MKKLIRMMRQEFDEEAKTSGNNVPVAQTQGGANVGNIYVTLTTLKDHFCETTIEISGTSGRGIERLN